MSDASVEPGITVVVPVHNNAFGARRTLGALAALAGEHEQLEVVVDRRWLD